MARQTKDKKRILDDQLAFNFEENTVEHYYIEKPKRKEKMVELVKLIFRKQFVAVKISHKQRRHHGYTKKDRK